MNQRSLRLAAVMAVLISACLTGTAFAQAAPAVITKSFTPAVVALNGSSIATITVTNPNLACRSPPLVSATPCRRGSISSPRPAARAVRLLPAEGCSISIPGRSPFPAHPLCLPAASPARSPSKCGAQPSASISTPRRQSPPTTRLPAPPRQQRSPSRRAEEVLPPCPCRC